MSRRSSATRTVTLERTFRKIMLALDGPENSAKAIELAMSLAASNRAELVVTHVVPVYQPLIAPFGAGVPFTLVSHISEVEAEEAKRTSRWLERLVGVAEERGIDASKVMIRGQASVAEELTRRADEEGADLIVVGMNKRGVLERFIVGSTSSALIKQAACPVLVAH